MRNFVKSKIVQNFQKTKEILKGITAQKRVQFLLNETHWDEIRKKMEFDTRGSNKKKAGIRHSGMK